MNSVTIPTAAELMVDWRSLFGLANLLSIAGIVVSIYYAKRADQKATNALQAARAARRELLIRFAAEEFTELLVQLRFFKEAARAGDLNRASQLADVLNAALAAAKTAWAELPEIQHGEIGIASRELKRIVDILRDVSLPTEEKIARSIEAVDFVNVQLGLVRGRLRLRSN